MSESQSPDALLGEALKLRRAGRLPEAIRAARRLTELEPRRLDGWFLWGTMALASGRFSEAEQVLGEGARLSPALARSRFLVPRARALVTLGRCAEAVAVAREVAGEVTLASDFNTLSAVLSQAGLPEEALPLSEKAVALEPQASDAWNNLGSLHQFLGRMDAAEVAYKRAVAEAPNAAAWLALARLRKWRTEDGFMARLATVEAQNPLDEARLAYARFKVLDDVGRYDEAFAALSEGAIKAKTALGRWDAAQEAETVAAWREAFPTPMIPQMGTGGVKRLFIVGLPRSGTTLVERILAAHSGVQALGELQSFGLAVKRASKSRTAHLLDADTVKRAVLADPRDIAADYERETAYLWDGKSPLIIDKLPHNHDYCGLIRKAFPDAIIVHVRRSPMDSLFGSYRLLFAHAHKWSYDFTDLSAHYDHYRRLMAHWKAVLGEGLVEVSMEALIENPEHEIRILLASCGLDFEAACLSPHEAKGAVATASSSQVRKPINAEGVGVWRRYESGLAPLWARLRSMGYV